MHENERDKFEYIFYHTNPIYFLILTTALYPHKIFDFKMPESSILPSNGHAIDHGIVFTSRLLHE